MTKTRKNYAATAILSLALLVGCKSWENRPMVSADYYATVQAAKPLEAK